MELALMIIKPLQAGNSDHTQRIIAFTNKKLIEKFGKEEIRIIYDRLTYKGGVIAEKLYSNLEKKWENLGEMLKYFSVERAMHPYIFYGEDGVSEFLRSLAGKTERETNPETIRGMMREYCGPPEKEYMNFVHVAHPSKVKTELLILKDLEVLPGTIGAWKGGACRRCIQVDNTLEKTLRNYGLI